jgi:hypothetical protein
LEQRAQEPGDDTEHLGLLADTPHEATRTPAPTRATVYVTSTVRLPTEARACVPPSVAVIEAPVYPCDTVSVADHCPPVPVVAVLATVVPELSWREQSIVGFGVGHE